MVASRVGRVHSSVAEREKIAVFEVQNAFLTSPQRGVQSSKPAAQGIRVRQGVPDIRSRCRERPCQGNHPGQEVGWLRGERRLDGVCMVMIFSISSLRINGCGPREHGIPHDGCLCFLRFLNHCHQSPAGTAGRLAPNGLRGCNA